MINPILDLLGRRLRLAVIGGGPGSFIGPVHRTAARLDDRFEIVAGVLSGDAERSRAAAVSIGIAPDRAYHDWQALLTRERARREPAEVIAVMTPTAATMRSARRRWSRVSIWSATSRSPPRSRMRSTWCGGCGRVGGCSA